MDINVPDSTDALYHLLTNTDGISAEDVDEVLAGIISEQVQAMYDDRAHLAAQIAARDAEDGPDLEDVPENLASSDPDR